MAVLVNNPTYYGICSDLRAIVKMAHEAGMLCLADEAHGTHFYFGNGLPVSAMAVTKTNEVDKPVKQTVLDMGYSSYRTFLFFPML